MAIKRNYFKQKILMILDMLICLICAFILSIFFYKIGLINNIKIEIMVVSIILLPLTMVSSIILFKGYPQEQKINEKQFNRCIYAVFFGMFMYILCDIIFGYYQILAYKIVSALASSSFIIQLRVINLKIDTNSGQKIKNGEDQANTKKNIYDFVEQLLGRHTTNLDETKVNMFFQDKCIMVIGGAGFIGSSLTMKLASYQCKRIVIVDIDENNLFELKKQVEQYIDECIEISIEIASIRDYKRMDTIFAKYRPNVVYHGAAQKNTILAENCPEEAVKNNIFGTHTCAKLADIYGVDRFVLMSTNYANNPSSIIGATKRISEMVMQYMAHKNKGTRYTSIRFNNVLGSKGSALYIFENQIYNGGPITINNKNVMKKYIRVEEAVEAIIKVSMLTNGNDMYIYDGGKEILIRNLAQKFIKYKGLKLNKDITIEYTGEKVYNTNLDIKLDNLKEIENSNLYVVDNDYIETTEFYKKLSMLNVATKENDRDNVHKIMMEILHLFNSYEYATFDEVNVVEEYIT